MVYFQEVIERNLTSRIVESLQDIPVMYLQGARQTGKSTLAQLYLGDVVVPFGKNLWAVPVAMAWN
jgi:predicted AAA+ superfamily ATPase